MRQINEMIETIPGSGAPKRQMNAVLHSTSEALATNQEAGMPDIAALREEALQAGALDPTVLRFRIVEFDRHSGEMLGVPVADIGFSDALSLIHI